MKVLGFDKEKNVLIFSTNDVVVERNYDDCRKLSRKVNKCKDGDTNGLSARCIGMPTESFKKLISSEVSWKVNGEGWKPQMTRSVYSLEQWFTTLTSINPETLAEFVDDKEYARQKSLLAERKLIEARPRMLQQYFASDVNIASVLQFAYDGLEDRSKVTFVEPSCGDGRILHALLSSGARHVCGCDIDAVVAAQAVERVNSSLKEDQHCSVIVQDFLTTSRKSFAAHITTDDNNGNSNINSINNNCTSNHSRNDIDSSGCNTTSSSSQCIVVVGGPPYSIVNKSLLVDTSSSNTDLPENQTAEHFDYSASNRDDYPLLFLLHCALVRAERIVFILPDRCGSASFVAKATQLMNSAPKHDNDKTDPEVQSENKSCDSRRWRLTSSAVGDNSFDLVGKVIHQPAIIQRWDFGVNG